MNIIVDSVVEKENITFEDDLFGLKSHGELLLDLVKNSNEPLVISISGRYGTGKTTFVRMWQALLRDNDIPSIYFNAFENDYSNDAFAVMASAVLKLAQQEDIGEKYINNLKDRSREVMGQLLPPIADVAVMYATRGSVMIDSGSAWKRFRRWFRKTPVEPSEIEFYRQLDSWQEASKSFQAFKTALSKLPTELAKKKQDSDQQEPNPLIIIVDELDRCKPDFAVELVERAKHFFSVKNVIFVLSVHKKQLEASVKAIYGEGIEAHEYLQKFITLEMALPDKKAAKDTPSNVANHQDKDSYATYCGYLFEKHGFSELDDSGVHLEYIKNLVRLCGFSLRQIEKLFVNLAVFFQSHEQNHKTIKKLAIPLSVLKIQSPQVLQDIADEKATYQDVEGVIPLPPEEKENDNMSFRQLRGLLKFFFLSEEQTQGDPDKELIESFHSQHLMPPLSGEQSRKRELRLCAQKLLWFSVDSH